MPIISKTHFEAGVRADATPTGHLEVYCNHCSISIGTMSLEEARRAIFGTLGRGGILCPECRKHTCDSCGITFQDKRLVGYIRGPKGDNIRVCNPCAQGWIALRQQVEYAVSKPNNKWGLIKSQNL